jgi:hypothetical protein
LGGDRRGRQQQPSWRQQAQRKRRPQSGHRLSAAGANVVRQAGHWVVSASRSSVMSRTGRPSARTMRSRWRRCTLRARSASLPATASQELGVQPPGTGTSVDWIPAADNRLRISTTKSVLPWQTTCRSGGWLTGAGYGGDAAAKASVPTRARGGRSVAAQCRHGVAHSTRLRRRGAAAFGDQQQVGVDLQPEPANRRRRGVGGGRQQPHAVAAVVRLP